MTIPAFAFKVTAFHDSARYISAELADLHMTDRCHTPTFPVTQAIFWSWWHMADVPREGTDPHWLSSIGDKDKARQTTFMGAYSSSASPASLFLGIQ